MRPTAFDVVIPSLPGYGFSDKPRELGWDPIRVARAWAVLMDRLGYKKYVAQGGDWGDAVNEQMALQKPAGLLGIHTNMPGTLPDNSGAGRRSAADRPDGRRGVCVEAARSIVSATRWKWEPGHRYSMGWRIRQSAWPRGCSTTIRRARRSSDGSSTGNREGLTRDDILDNITLYWLTDTAVSSARLFWESKLTFFAPKGVTIPVAVSAFPDEIYTAPRSWAEKAFPMLIHYNRLPKGGHFAAWEQPDIFAQELRASFKPLR